MAQEDETLEDVAASLLNGVMIVLLGAAFPAAFLWLAVSQRESWTIGLDAATAAAAGQVGALMFFSFLLLRTGGRLIRKSVTALRRRGRSPAQG